MSYSFKELEAEQAKLRAIEEKLDLCESDEDNDDFLTIRFGLSILQTTFTEFARLFKLKKTLNHDEAFVLIETIKESKKFVEMHENVFV